MTSQVSAKVRLVRCPKCRQVLVELPEVRLYKCGGCGTVLQAKNRKMETDHTELSSRESDSVAKSQQDNISEEKEARSSNHDLISPHHTSVSDEISSSPEINSPWGKDSPPEVKEPSKKEIGKTSGQISETCDDKFHDHENLPEHENEGTSGQTSETCDDKFRDHENLPEHENEETLGQTSEACDDKFRDHENLPEHENEETLGQTSEACDDKFRDHENLPEHEDEYGLRPRAKHGQRMKNNSIPSENDEKSQNCDRNDTISQSAEQSIEVDDKIEGLSTFRSSSPDKNVSASVEDSRSLVSFYLSSPDDERPDQKLTRNFERVSSVDTFGSSPLGEPSSELSGKHGDGTNYTRNGSYYAYDGSESSYDGIDDQISEHISHLSRKIKDSDYISTTERLKKDGLRANNEPETNYWATSTRAMKSRDIGGNKMRLDKHGVVSSGSRFGSRDVLGPRTENPSRYRHKLLPAQPGFHPPVPSSYSQPDKMDLLRTVCELKDQLSKMHFPTNREFAPFHYNHPGEYVLPRQQDWSEQPNFPRMAFSGEAARYRHQANCSCLHCCSQDRHYSAQLPSNCLHCTNDHCRVPTEHYTSSELSLRGCETNSANQRHRDNEMKRLYLKEKYNMTKRHIRPVVGGAPFVTCYYCSELLQLPADFLLFKKRYHQLMCNACQKVLNFSLLKRTHLVPYSNDGSAPPPSETDEYNDTTTRRNCEPVSCSDDYGHSFCQSCSTSFDKGERNFYNRKMSLESSYEPVEDRKMKSILRESANKNEIVESVGPSSKMSKWNKVTSEIESSNSPLHRLMGYTSPSQVLNKRS
ncbi:hypothetical protein BUALT_Bualt06G0074800 [Buddleja alternifolia]|uniref:Zinc-ribbon domain-containing protein n=1 Tax=Buddleja alternifolia TaxID=168488 RepID=A0AAV6XPA8_9LAMI|nr:hypothetical protein BUALT_Bualt06G0074800 [Buddleja alternifolia]